MINVNFKIQKYKGMPIRLINRDYTGSLAKRFLIGDSNQNVWIPNKHLSEDGTIREGENIDYIFRKANAQRKFYYAHVKFTL
jgi:hypothetical protein